MFGLVDIYECNKVFSWHGFIEDMKNSPIFNSQYIKLNKRDVGYSLYPDGKSRVWYTKSFIDRLKLDNRYKTTSFSGIWFKVGIKTVIVYNTEF